MSVHADDSLLLRMVPAFLLQPLVENAIRHGVGTRLSGGRVDVSIFADGSALQVRVRDDGVGLPAEWSFERDAGVGLKNVADRLEHIYGTPDLLKLVRVPSGGVEAQIVLPAPPAGSDPGQTGVRPGSDPGAR